MKEVTTVEAAKLLNLSSSRLRQLLSAGRVKGARRIGGGEHRAAMWVIPLAGDGKPSLLPLAARKRSAKAD